jgi:hypothetical protein
MLNHGLSRHLTALDWRNREGRAAAVKAIDEAFSRYGQWVVGDSRKLLKPDS